MGPALPLLAALLLQVAPPPTDPAFDPDRQVRWEHTFEDALELARAEGRPLLIAVNADGESASEAIVRERYRDPEWVANTRPFVCVVASFFRHTPRDYDDAGHRIPCPRLGEVTCGEHMALEPLVHDGPLTGARIDLFGEEVGRISPRHTLIDRYGEKSLDLFLLFDLGVLDQALALAAGLYADLGPRPVWRSDPVSGPVSQQQLRALAAERDGGARSFFERWLQRAGPHDLWSATTAILHDGNTGSLGALRVLVARAEDPLLMARIGYVAATVGLEAELGQAIRGRILSVRATPPTITADTGIGTRAPTYDGAPQPLAATWLETLCRLDPAADSTRELALSFLAFGSTDEWRAVNSSAGALGLADAREWVQASAGAFDLDAFLAAARLDREVLPGTVEPELGTADELLESLDDLGARAAAQPGDPQLEAELGRTLLALARRRIEAGGAGGGIPFLLQDARDTLARAAQSLPDDAQLWLDLARAAYYRSDFEEQESSARSALEALAYEPGTLVVDALTVDALRWLGDALARRISERATAPVEVRAEALASGIHALAAAAIGPGADATDWESLASFCSAAGRPGAATRLALEGLQRYPEADPLHALFHNLLAGRPELVASSYHALARAHPESAACAWYVGYAEMLVAEWRRRSEQSWLSIRSYSTAERQFRRTIELNEGFRESSEFFIARCALGRGFAHLLAGSQAEAATALVDAASARPDAVFIGDGLSREAVDLVDGVLELRASGPSPVEPLAWLDRLAEVDAENSDWPRLVSDAELREALRAVGRGEPVVAEAYVRPAVDAARRAVALEAAQAEEAGEQPLDSGPSGRALAQAATVLAELLLEPEQPTEEALFEVRALIGEAGPHLDLGVSIQPVEAEGLRVVVSGLREALGVARPVLRPGR